MIIINWPMLLLWKGQNPQTILNKTTPSDQISDLIEQLYPLRIQGAMQIGEPSMVFEIQSQFSKGLQKPKSASLIIPSCRRRFSGLRSRCMMLCLLRTLNASIIWPKQVSAAFSGRWPFYLRSFQRVPPLQYSQTKQKLLTVLSMSQYLMICGDGQRLVRMLISLYVPSSNLGYCLNFSALTILMATSCLVFILMALKTVEQLPLPISFCNEQFSIIFPIFFAIIIIKYCLDLQNEQSATIKKTTNKQYQHILIVSVQILEQQMYLDDQLRVMQFGSLISNRLWMKQTLASELQTADPILNLKSLVPTFELQNTRYPWNASQLDETLEAAQDRVAPVSPYIFLKFSSIAMRLVSLAIKVQLNKVKPVDSLVATSVSVLASGDTIQSAYETRVAVPSAVLSKVRKSCKQYKLFDSNLIIASSYCKELLTAVVSFFSKQRQYYLVPLVYLRRMELVMVVFQSTKLPVERSWRQLTISNWKSVSISVRLRADYSQRGMVEARVIVSADAQQQRRVMRRVLIILFIILSNQSQRHQIYNQITVFGNSKNQKSNLSQNQLAILQLFSVICLFAIILGEKLSQQIVIVSKLIFYFIVLNQNHISD